MIIANIIALSIAIIGCLNWFLVGVFSWNLVTWIFGVGLFTRIIYAIVGIAGIWLLIQLLFKRTRLFASQDRRNQ
ncbi:MAG: DUF378 domain-containing protein [bacterium]|nr:DUF378 domain-containing protein [bacterium]